MSKKQKWFHYFGLVASALCLVHCLLTPLLIMVFPLLFEQDHHSLNYELFFLLLLALASLTFWQGYTIHGSRKSLITAGIGFVLLFSSLLVKKHGLDIALSMMGGSAMLIAHYWNYKKCHCHPHPH